MIDWRGELKIADGGLPAYGVAGTLLVIAEKWEESGKGYDEFNWLDVEAPLGELIESRLATTKVRSFAKNRKEWIYDAQHHLDILDRAGLGDILQMELGGPGGGPIELKDVTLTDEHRNRAVSSLAEAIAAGLHLGDVEREDAVDATEQAAVGGVPVAC